MLTKEVWEVVCFPIFKGMLGRIGGQEEKGTTEHEMAGWHHRLNGHESE